MTLSPLLEWQGSSSYTMMVENLLVCVQSFFLVVTLYSRLSYVFIAINPLSDDRDVLAKWRLYEHYYISYPTQVLRDTNRLSR